MVTRRIVLGMLAAAPVALALGPALAGGRRVGSLYRGRVVWGTRPRGRNVVPLVGGGFAVVGGTFRATDPHLYSIANANDRYTAWFDLGRQPRARELCLALPGGAMVSSVSSWSAYAAAEIGFEVSADDAAALAAIWGIARQDRVSLERELVASWRPRTRIVGHGDPALIDLAIENRGATTVFVQTSTFVGDDFTFAATKGGVAVPPIPRGFSTGPAGSIQIDPGTTVTITADLREAARIDHGGVYTVSCTFRAALLLDPTASSVDHAHERWDLTATGAVEVRIE